MVNFYFKIIHEPMLEFKRDILKEVGKRQDMEQIEKEIEKEIEDSKKRFQ